LDVQHGIARQAQHIRSQALPQWPLLLLVLLLVLHPKFDFKKHGNGIHPPICFLFKCVSKAKARPVNTMASLLSIPGEIA
jgi:hypothetical protein